MLDHTDLTVFAVRPDDPSEDLAVFIREEDAERFRATFDNVGDVERCMVADRATAERMIRERIEDEDPEDDWEDR